RSATARPNPVSAALTRRWPRLTSSSNSEGGCSKKTLSRSFLFGLLQAEFFPEQVDASLHFGAHCDRPTPDARSFRGPFVGCVDSHLRSEPRDRARKIQIVDGRIFDDEHVENTRSEEHTSELQSPY